MAEKNKSIMQKFDSADITAKDAVGLVSKFRGKHNRIKVPGNKKLTKKLIKTCPHHFYGKGGKYKNSLKNEGGRLKCTACGKYVNIKPTTEEDDKKLQRDMEKFYDLTEYLMVEANAADESITKAIIFSRANLKKIFKTKARITEALAKNGKKGNKNNKGKGKHKDSTLTNWFQR